MKNHYLVIHGRNHNSAALSRLLLMGCLYLVAAIFSYSAEFSARATHYRHRGREGQHVLAIRMEVRNCSNSDAFLPSKNLGPLITTENEAITCEFRFIPRRNRNEEIYAESESSFAPVILRPGDLMLIESSLDILESEKPKSVRVVYVTADDRLKIYGFTPVSLSADSTSEPHEPTKAR